MNPPKGPDADERSHALQSSGRLPLVAVSLLGAAIALVASNVLLYQHARSVEYQYQHSLTTVRPWILPEGACEVFLLAWFVVLIACSLAAFRIRHKLFQFEVGLLGTVAVVALIANAYCLLWEAFRSSLPAAMHRICTR